MGATAILSRSSFAFAGGAAVCAHATMATNPIAHTTPTRVPRRPHLCIVLSSFLRRQPYVLQVGEEAGNHPREHILRNILGIRGGFREEPEHGHISELVELLVPYLPQQAGPLPRVHYLA